MDQGPAQQQAADGQREAEGRDRIAGVVPDDRRRIRQERRQQQEREVQPDHRSRHLAHLVEEPVVLPPHDPQDVEGQYVGEEGRTLVSDEVPQPGYGLGLRDAVAGVEVGGFRPGDLDDQQRHRDREHGVSEEHDSLGRVAWCSALRHWALGHGSGTSLVGEKDANRQYVTASCASCATARL
jgi:hypothetical protein